MRTTMTLLMLLVLFLSACDEQYSRLSRQQKAQQILAETYGVRHQSVQWNLPEGAVARLGKGSIRQVQYSPDGSHLTIVGSMGIWLYDTETYREVAVLTGYTSEITYAAFSPDSKTLVGVSYYDHTMWLWDTETSEPKGTFIGQTGAVDSVTFSPDGKILATEGRDTTVRLWDTETWKLKEPLTEHTEDIVHVAFSPDGATLVSGGKDGVQLWDAVTWEHKQMITGPTPKLFNIAFSPDGKLFVVQQTGEKTLSVWRTETWEQKQPLTADPKSGIGRAVFSPDGTTIASREWEGCVGVGYREVETEA